MVVSGACTLKMESDFGRQGAGRYVMRAAEGGEEVIERVLVGKVDADKTQAPLVPVAAEEVSTPTDASKRLRGAIRGGFLSSSSVLGTGIRTSLEVSASAAQVVKLVVGVARTPSQASPAWNCSSGVRPLMRGHQVRERVRSSRQQHRES